MQTTTPNTDHPPVDTGEIELLDADTACRLLGGTRPLNRATLYRGIKDGRFPAPVKIGTVTSRWIKSECIAAIQTMIAARDGDAA